VTGCGTSFIGGPLQRKLGSLTRIVLDWVGMAPHSTAPVAVTTLGYYSTEARPPQLLARELRQQFGHLPRNNIGRGHSFQTKGGQGMTAMLLSIGRGKAPEWETNQLQHFRRPNDGVERRAATTLSCCLT